MKRTGVMCAAQLVGALIVFGLIGCAGDATKKTVTVDGSSTVFPVSEAAAEEFQKANRGIKVTVALSGTGGGFKKFGRGDIDISDASRPIMAKEIEECKKNDIDFIELPVCFDALTVVVNKENDFVDHLTVDELKMMWSKESKDKITKWSDIRKSWPKEKFILFGPGTDSGTFDYFTEAINGKAGNSRDDYTASEDDNVLVTGVAKNKYALGYFGFAYYAPNKDKLKAIPIQWSKGKVKEPVEPSSEGIIQGTYAPLSRPLFIYVNKKAATDRAEVKKFVEFYLENAAALARRKKYVPLPEKVYEVVRERFKEMKTGTAFGGVPEVGVPIEDIMKRELK
jgi:phosphate transport system substrate-binding protein